MDTHTKSIHNPPLHTILEEYNKIKYVTLQSAGFPDVSKCNSKVRRDSTATLVSHANTGSTGACFVHKKPVLSYCVAMNNGGKVGRSLRKYDSISSISSPKQSIANSVVIV